MEPRETWEPKETRYHVPRLAGEFLELLSLLLFKCAIFQPVDGLVWMSRDPGAFVFRDRESREVQAVLNPTTLLPQSILPCSVLLWLFKNAILPYCWCPGDALGGGSWGVHPEWPPAKGRVCREPGQQALGSPGGFCPWVGEPQALDVPLVCKPCCDVLCLIPPRVHAEHKDQKGPQGFGARSACRALPAPEEWRGPRDQM